MNKKLLYLATLLMMVLGFSACDDEKAVPPVYYPEVVGDGTGLDPYNVGTALAKIYKGDYDSKFVFVKGIVSQVTEFGASYGNITYYISDDGTTTNELEVYRGLGLNGEKFTAITDLKVGDEVIIYCTLTYYNNTYPETGQGAKIVSLNGSDWTPDPVIDPAGTGIKEDPFNVTKALEVILGDNCPTEKVYVKGVVSQIDNIDTSYGNAVYYISDTGSRFAQLEIYRGYSLGGAKFTSTTEIKEGDEVTVYGQVVNFNGTPEFTTGSMITVLNGTENDPNKGGSTAEPKGSGTQADPYNVAMAQKVITGLAADTPTDKVYVEGIISNVGEISTSFGNGTFSISDDGSSAGELLIYRAYYLNGDKFTSEDQIKVGDKVIVYGQLINFKGNTPEMTQGGQIFSLNGQGSPTPDPGPDPNPNPDPITATSADFNTFNGGVANNIYETYKTAQGWVATNTQILAGGVEVTNFVSTDPKFLFPCLNGRANKGGTLTSPLIAGGIKKLTFNYGFPYNETKVKFTVNILQGGSVVATETVTVDSPVKAQVYTFTKDLNISGDFTIEIVNDQYSQTSTGNKDRVAIWNLTWEN